MKYTALIVTLAIVVAFANASFESTWTPPLEDNYFEGERFRREANPQGSITLDVNKPLGGPDRRPSLDLNYQQHLYDRNGLTGDAYGGLNIRPGQSAQPHVGFKFGREYRNGFVNGFGQVQRGPHGRPDPTFGVNAGFRFRRDADSLDFEDQAEE